MNQLSTGVVQGMAERVASGRAEGSDVEHRSVPTGKDSLETPMWLRLANAEGLLRETLADLRAANNRIAQLEHELAELRRSR